MAERFDPDWTIAPGETLRELLQEREWTPRDLARRLDWPMYAVVDVLAGTREIKPRDAADLAEVTDVAASFWLALERRYREDLKAGKKDAAA